MTRPDHLFTARRTVEGRVLAAVLDTDMEDDLP